MERTLRFAPSSATVPCTGWTCSSLVVTLVGMPSTRIVEVNSGTKTSPLSWLVVRLAAPLNVEPGGSVIDWFSFLTVSDPPTW